LKQINSHLVAAAAYPVLEERGELLQSRTPGPAQPVAVTAHE
ncbi:phosphate:Na+ symporter, partial [Rhizobium sp. BK609]|nr:phosphate:Na+ symporter [Rhizobium sp. BK609]